VRVKNLPPSENFNRNLEQLRAMLHWHITDVVKKENQVIYEMSERFMPGVDHAEIVSISFGLKDFRDFELLQKIEAIGKQGQKLRQKQHNLKGSDEKESRKIDQQCEKLLAKGKALGEEYRTIQDKGKQNEVKCAFVTFRTMEGAARLL
jgi:uncharacterized protein YjcR